MDPILEEKMNLLGMNFRLHNKRLSSAWIVVVLMLALLLVACGGSADDADAPTSETEDTSEAPAEADVDEAAEAGSDTDGENVLRVAMQPIVQTDPAFISLDSEILVANHVSMADVVDIDDRRIPDHPGAFRARRSGHDPESGAHPGLHSPGQNYHHHEP